MKRLFCIFLTCFFSAVFSIHPQIFEKIESTEIEDFYIDEQTTNLVLKLLDESKLEQEVLKEETEEKDFFSKPLKKIRELDDLSIPDDEFTQNLIHRYIRQFTTNYGKQNLFKILDAGESYRLYIRRELKKRGMPAFLEYLPVVESEYNPSAVSKSGAKGLWQFMENSIHPFMKKTEYYDERLDPWKSTDAALSKLQDNYRMFNDWFLAIAAYNCGAGAMTKSLKNAEKKNFWYLAKKGLIREETLHYIPKLIAISTIAENADEYEIILPDTTISMHFADFDYIIVNKSVSLSRLASELRLDYATLKILNNELTKAITPENETYRLRLPEGMEESGKLALTEILGQ